MAAVVPDKDQMRLIKEKCLEAFDSGITMGPIELSVSIMKEESLPMHCPYHHYLVPAVLLTSAHMSCGSSREKLESHLEKAEERAGEIPGGICGKYGCCGAAVGAGIFISVFLKTTPLSKEGWAACNDMTARCLSAIAQVEGPRCCKRVTFLALAAAVTAAKDLLDVKMPEEGDITCTFFNNNKECRREACPFYKP